VDLHRRSIGVFWRHRRHHLLIDATPVCGWPVAGATARGSTATGGLQVGCVLGERKRHAGKLRIGCPKASRSVANAIASSRLALAVA